MSNSGDDWAEGYDRCGEPTADGEPCQNRATEGDHCWLKGHGGHAKTGRIGKLEKMDDIERSQLTDDIAHVIEQGGSITEAARKSGIHRETITRWINRGEDEDEGVYAEFSNRLVRALGESEATYRSALIEIAIETNDTATLMAMLKQRHPDEWQDVDRGKQMGTVVINFDEETIETAHSATHPNAQSQ